MALAHILGYHWLTCKAPKLAPPSLAAAFCRVAVRGSFLCAKAAAPMMRERDYGKIINLASGILSPEGDLPRQFTGVYNKLKIALARCAVTPDDIIRQRVFVIGLVPEYRALAVVAMGEFYGGSRPASTLVGVSALIVPGALVKIDVTAAI